MADEFVSWLRTSRHINRTLKALKEACSTYGSSGSLDVEPGAADRDEDPDTPTLWEKISLIWKSNHDAKAEADFGRTLESHQRGYPSLAAVQDFDATSGVYRRFGYLQARLLLEKQDGLRLLEEELKRLDDAHEQSKEYDVRKLLYSRRDINKEIAATKRDLLKQIEEGLQSYASLLRTAQELKSFNQPSEEEWAKVGVFMRETEPLYQEENSFIHHRGDLVSLSDERESGWLDVFFYRIIETLRLFFPVIMNPLFATKDARKKSFKGRPVYDHGRLAGITLLVLTSAVSGLLVIPIYILYRLTKGTVVTQRDISLSLAVLLVATIIFSIGMSVTTKARRQEVVAVSAGYCAVLVVFLGAAVPPQQVVQAGV